MQNDARTLLFVPLALAACFVGATSLATAQPPRTLPQAKLPAHAEFPNPSGMSETLSSTGPIDPTSPFFQSLGTNGRSCGTCHQPDQAWAISAAQTQMRFVLTGGTDPLFRTNDGSNCDHNIDVSSVAGRSQAYSLLITRGLIRVAIDVPANAEFKVVAVQNPYGCNETKTLSMYRRPLPTANLKFLSTVMWDGRESTASPTQKITFATNPGDLAVDLFQQAQDATSGHAQGILSLTHAQQQAIVDFEMGMSTAQIVDANARRLNAGGARGGARALAAEQFFIGINDPLGGNPFNTPFSSSVFSLFGSWADAPADSGRASVARGEALFNTKPIQITGVNGLNDTLNQPVVAGFCGTCHSALNAGNHSVSLPINIGVADLTNPLGVEYLPVVTLQNVATGAKVQTTDVGRAMVTGKWADVGKFKGPVLRGLAARAPYFHNGSARSLKDVVDFYDSRFQIGFTQREKEDLVAFLKAL
jgi:cytochrome c peroxidase